jgi:hypothetical protein
VPLGFCRFQHLRSLKLETVTNDGEKGDKVPKDHKFRSQLQALLTESGPRPAAVCRRLLNILVKNSKEVSHKADGPLRSMPDNINRIVSVSSVLSMSSKRRMVSIKAQAALVLTWEAHARNARSHICFQCGFSNEDFEMSLIAILPELSTNLSSVIGRM